jgi:general secretion pathway protein C
VAGIDSLAKRYHTVIIGGLLVTVAYFQGSGIGSLIEEQLHRPGPAASSSTDPEDALEKLKAQSKKSAPKLKSGSDILSRNPFDSITGPVGAKVPSPKSSATHDERPAASSAKGNVPPRCSSGEVSLIAGALDPAYSFAVIKTGSESKMRRIGDEVDGKKVESIHGESVVLASGTGDRCRLTMHDEVEAPVGTGKAGRSATSSTTSATSMTSGAEDDTTSSSATKRGPIPGLRRVSDTEYVIEENAEQKLTQMRKAFTTSAKVVDGQGLRLYRAAQTTILGHLGLKKGDIVKTVNGFDMSALDQSTEAYEKLTSAKNVQMVVEREGKPVTIDVKVE